MAIQTADRGLDPVPRVSRASDYGRAYRMRLSEPTNVPSPESGSYQSAEARIVGKGEMAGLVRAFDWASTPLGPIENWSRELVAIVNLTLCSHNPARILWGPELVL